MKVRALCTSCGRMREPDMLDYEAWIHHGNPLQCFDRRECERHRRRQKRRRTT